MLIFAFCKETLSKTNEWGQIMLVPSIFHVIQSIFGLERLRKLLIWKENDMTESSNSFDYLANKYIIYIYGIFSQNQNIEGRIAEMRMVAHAIKNKFTSYNRKPCINCCRHTFRTQSNSICVISLWLLASSIWLHNR